MYLFQRKFKFINNVFKSIIIVMTNRLKIYIIFYYFINTSKPVGKHHIPFIIVHNVYCIKYFNERS